MAKKLSKNIDYFEEYRLIAIVSNLKDYSLCYHINKALNLDLVNYEDMIFDLASNPGKTFSWYFQYESRNRSTYYLFANKSEGSFLIPAQKTVDFFLLIKDVLNDELVSDISNKLRKVPGLSAVFNVNMHQIKNLEPLLETIELHELEYVRKQ